MTTSTYTTPQPPYRDDYDNTKKYYRVLYKPAHPVQARELTQQQTTLQNQIEKFGRHVFDEGSLVYGGQFDIDTQFPYVILSSENSAGNTVDPTSFVNTTVIGQSSGVKGRFLQIQQITYEENAYYVGFVRYLAGPEDTASSLDKFIAGEILEDVSNSLNTIQIESEQYGEVPIFGVGSLFTIEAGVVFSNGLFLDFDKQAIILDAFSSEPTCKVGFTINTNIIGYGDDETLLDNANGTPNYNAPGADRLKLDPILTKIDIDATNSLPEFVELFTLKNGVVQTKFDRSQYAIIGDEIAKRTYDESGDYCIRGMGIRIREHLNTGENEGYLLEANGGDSNKLDINIEPGLAYVKGYEINKLVTSHIETDKSFDFEYVNSQILSARSSNYLVLNEIVGIPSLDTGTIVDLYSGSTSPDVGEQRVTNSLKSTDTPSGTKLGTAKVKSFVYDSNSIGTPNGQIRLYLYDIQMLDDVGGFKNIRSVHTSTPTDFFADVVVNNTSGNAELKQKYTYPLLYSIGTKFTKTIRSENDLSDTTFTFQRMKSNLIINSNGTLSVSLNIANEKYGYGAGNLNSSEKQSVFLCVNEDIAISQPGTINGISGQTTITGSGTSFTNLNVGDKIEINDSPGVTGTYIITSITNDTTLTVDRALTETFVHGNFDKVYYTGDYINLLGKGSDAGETRTVTCNTARTTLSFDVKETFSSTINVSVGFLVSRSTAYEAKKLLKSHRFVQINCSSFDWGSPENFKKEIPLGFSDIFKIHQIRKHSSSFSSDTDGTDVTDQFIFDNGQKNDYYDHGTIKLRDGYSLTTSDYLLIELDYFLPDFSLGIGYFSIDSYPIDDTQSSNTTIYTHEVPIYRSTQTNNQYNLRDVLDFRSVKTNTANDATSVGSASTNPSRTDTFVQAANGLRIPYPTSQITIDYSYYLARRDIVTLDINGRFGIVKGISDVFPVSPPIPDNVMGVAKIYIPPYPSLATSYGRLIGREDIACVHNRMTFERHTMRDIGVLKSRINNLEYYTSLNALEKNASEQVILDENGLERFKNGFFVDPFVDHSLGDTLNDDYKIGIDPNEQCLRPRFTMNSGLFRYLNNFSSGIQIGKSIITLPYEEESFIEQLKATSYRNIEQSVFRFIGTIQMFPDTDIWVDTTTVDKTFDFDFSTSFSDTPILETKWNSWQTDIVGYSVYDRERNDRSGTLNDKYYIGTYNTLKEAEAAASLYDPANSNTNEEGTARAITGGARAIIVENSSGLKSGINTIISNETQLENFGTYVTDVRLTTYIRPQIIKVVVRGLKANTIFYTFFDGENMSEYCSQATIPVNWDGDENYDFTFGTEGETLRSNAYGELIFNLRLPTNGKRFRVGTREIKVTDSPTNAIDATSYAENYFVGHGLIQKKQNTIISTKQTIVKNETVSETRTKQKVKILGPSCMAYSFLVNAPEDEDGVFLTSTDVWIQSIDDTNELGVWFEIREMNNAGEITRTQVPYSEVWMRYGDPRIKTSDDATEYTRVNFENPVFLQNDTQYAFVIHTEGLNPNTYFYVSRIGETDLESNKQVTARQLTGNVYTTNNNLDWSIVPDIDLKVRFNRAKFNVGTGTAIFGNTKKEFLTIQDRSQIFVQYGEQIRGSEQLIISGTTGTDSIEVGDIITGDTSNTIGTVLAIDGSTYYTDAFDYESGETFTVTSVFSPTGLKDVVGTITTINYGIGYIEEFSRRTNKLILKNSNGYFFNSANIKGMTTNTTATITTVDNYPYSTIYYNPNYLIFKNTDVDFSLKSVISSSGQLSSYEDIIPKQNKEYTTQRDLYSYSNEIMNFNGSSSSQSKAILSTTSDWVSPIIDMNRTSGIYIYNILNDDITGEDDPYGGNLENKYLSSILTLAEGQDAEDLIIYLTAYCPPGLSSYFPVKVWAKILNNEDGEFFTEKNWIELEKQGENTVYSSLINKLDYKDYLFKFPDDMVNSESEINPGIQYIANGNTYTGYKQYAIKIGLLGDENDTAIYPKVSNIRAIALQM